jgi:hypothetical protein
MVAPTFYIHLNLFKCCSQTFKSLIVSNSEYEISMQIHEGISSIVNRLYIHAC